MTQKILLVEDDADLSMSMKALLEDIFHSKIEITQAYTGIDAIKILKANKEEPFAIALLDLMVKQLSGYELLGEIQKDPSFSDMLCIIISGSPNANVFGLQRNVPVFNKPVHIAELVDKIKKRLNLEADLRGFTD